MKAIVSTFKSHVLILGTLVALMWGVEILDLSVFRNGLDSFGILPRNPIGLRGILFAPFLHGGFAHLQANTAPFLILGWLIMSESISHFVMVSVICMVVGGLGTWVFGATAFHIGASGVIFGYLGFLLARWYFDRSIRSAIIALAVGSTYGAVLWGVLPTMPGVSWEGHLFGFLGGIIAARSLAKPILKAGG
jgi:membrane associated rhomboid family serine protease